MRRLALILALVLAPLAVQAVQPDEMLQDPALEARARTISAGLRCLVCRNESIDDSDASLAHDLRVLVRQRLTAGDSDAQVVQYLVSRYGEFVLLKPTTGGANLILWLSGRDRRAAERRRREAAGANPERVTRRRALPRLPSRPMLAPRPDRRRGRDRPDHDL